MISISIDASIVLNVRGSLESMTQLPENPQIGDIYCVRNDLDPDMYDTFVCIELNPPFWYNIPK